MLNVETLIFFLVVTTKRTIESVLKRTIQYISDYHKVLAECEVDNEVMLS